MRFTEQQNLPCLDGTDMAAVALYMQCFAEQVEGALSDASDEYTSFLNPPVAIWSNTATGSITDGQFFGFSNVVSNNWPGGPPSATQPTLPNLRGWYYIGANVNLIDLTAPIANRYRAVILTATQTAGVTGSPTIGQFQDTTYESATANGENLLPAGTVFFASGTFTSPNPVNLTLQYRSDDGANAVDTTQTPPIRLWVVYLGETPQIGVA